MDELHADHWTSKSYSSKKKGTITFLDELHADHWTSKSYSSKKKGTITFLVRLHVGCGNSFYLKLCLPESENGELGTGWSVTMSDEQPLVQKNLATQLKKVIIPKETYSSKKKGTISYVPPEYIIDGYVHSSLSHKSMKKTVLYPPFNSLAGTNYFFWRLFLPKMQKPTRHRGLQRGHNL